jgi:beta-galactosidase
MKRTNMNIIPGFLISVFLFTGCTHFQKSDVETLPVTDDPRTEILFDFGWRFNRGDVENGEASDLDASSWRMVDLPHDWSIEDIPGTDSPIDSNSVGAIDAGYTVGGTGWYRKTFFVPSGLQGKHFNILFEGIYMNADIWLNGRHLGNHPYGYTSFWYDITDNIKYGSENILAVEVKNEGRNSRWYSGSGIYRHVWLNILNPVHIEQWGTKHIILFAANTQQGCQIFPVHKTTAGIKETVLLRYIYSSLRRNFLFLITACPDLPDDRHSV